MVGNDKAFEESDNYMPIPRPDNNLMITLFNLIH
jgi:hypothetical protein